MYLFINIIKTLIDYVEEFDLKGCFFLGLIVFMGCSQTCVHA